ncbi:MAG: hypothetical protein IJI38_05815, partial [Clostridia bacterium]|nr:hypothetical protein [Clostridia bacterium]
ALKVLKNKLMVLEKEKQENEMHDIKGEEQDSASLVATRAMIPVVSRPVTEMSALVIMVASQHKEHLATR